MCKKTLQTRKIEAAKYTLS